MSIFPEERTSVDVSLAELLGITVFDGCTGEMMKRFLYSSTSHAELTLSAALAIRDVSTRASKWLNYISIVCAQRFIHLFIGQPL